MLAATGIVVCIRFLLATLPLPVTAPAVTTVGDTSLVVLLVLLLLVLPLLVLSPPPLTKKLFLF
jgi:hypothetical protein